jgi:hypothetical protein
MHLAFLSGISCISPSPCKYFKDYLFVVSDFDISRFSLEESIALKKYVSMLCKS